MNNPIPVPPRQRMFMQPIVGRKRASYSAHLVFFAIPPEPDPPPAKKSQQRIKNPYLLELTTFHIKS